MASESGDVRQFPRHITVDELRAEAENLADQFGEVVEFDTESFLEEYETLVAARDFAAAARLVLRMDAIVQSWGEHLHFVAYTYNKNEPKVPKLVVYSGKITDYIAGKPDKTINWDEYLNGTYEVEEVKEPSPQLAFVIRATEKTEEGNTVRYWQDSTRPTISIPLDAVFKIYKDRPPIVPHQATQ